MGLNSRVLPSQGGRTRVGLTAYRTATASEVALASSGRALSADTPAYGEA